MPIIELPQNIIAQVRPIPLFDEVFTLAPAGVKTYQNISAQSFLSIHLQNQFAATLIVSGTSIGGQVIVYYNGALAAGTSYHLEIGSAKMNVAVQITNVDVGAGNISIIFHCLQAV